MKSRRLLYSRETGVQDINVSPLIDIVFILLIFFIVTTVFVEETGVDVQRPSAVSSEDLQKESVLIAITPLGGVIYGDEDIGVNGVRGVVSRQLNKDPNVPVIIQADSRVSLELYTRVHDQASLAGAVRISLATQKE